MATDQKDEGRPHNSSDAAWKREAEAMEVEDKIAALIDLSRPEEPHYTLSSEEEVESGRVLSEVETDILSSASSTQGALERTFGDVAKWMVIPFLLVLVVLFIAVLGFAMTRGDAQSPTPAAPAPAAAQAPAAAAGAVGPATDCEVARSDIIVTSEVTGTNKTDHSTVFQGTTTITNESSAPVYVALRKSQSTGSEASNGRTDEGWFGGPFLLAPGEQRVERISAQAFTDGERMWTLLTDYAPFAGTTACLNQLFTVDSNGFGAIAVPIVDPFPVGP